jgi:3-mercaptopyruvate sulfurtransferase SseA
LAQRLIEKGYTKVYALKGGWNEWVKSKYPLEQRVEESAEKTDADKKTAQEQKNDKKSSEKKE